MLNGILHTIIEEKLYDEQYVQANTDDFDKLVENVKNYPPEEMEKVCGIPAETLREVARLYARAEAAIIFWGMGVSQHIHGTDNTRCLIALALSTGQVGRPGTGLHPLRGQNNVQGASDAGLIPMFFPDYKSVEDPEIRGRYEQLWGTKLDPKRGLTVVEIMDAIHEGSINGMYIMGENPAMSDPDVQHAREALAKLDHLVVQDIFMTETAKYADVVLPASAWPEKDGTVSNTNRQVQMGRAALPLPGQARPDLDIIIDLAKGVGLDWGYKHVSEVFTEMVSVMPSLQNITWERVERENSVTYPVDGPDVAGHDIVFGDGFPTANGRGRFVPATLISPAEEPDTEYPMVLTTGRQLEHWHTGSMTRRSAVLDDLEPEAVAYVSARDMERLGSQTGQFVQVSTRRGSIRLKARIDGAIPPGLIFIPFAYAEAAANVLTNPQLDPFGKIPEFKYCAARIEPAPERVLEAAE
jgi:formate dehydrogenase major subunit